MRSRRPSDDRLATWRSFLEAHTRVIRRLDQELQAEHGFGLDWYDVLFQLHDAGGRRTMSDLADAVLLTRPNCTRLVDRLVNAGLVRREPDPDDARMRWAELTDDGVAALRRASPTHLAGIERYVTRHLDDATSATLRAVFGAVLDSLADSPA
ncbi:MAG: MarR family transcriptional regulator [Acidimicrobiales bacterium]|nr:MarR family transcriptional regulator [Acidimicrobiales bacterium]